MASKSGKNEREYESHVDTGKEMSCQITLSGTPSTVTTVTIPVNYKGFRIYSASDDLRFGVSQTVAAVGTSSSTTVTISDFAIGGVVIAGQWETRLLPNQDVGTTTERTITLSSTSASSVLTLELF